ncbi:hypothetical protein ACEPPN_007359 [Leptodophora sp. 'Broadleaf-Isolate-01']
MVSTAEKPRSAKAKGIIGLRFQMYSAVQSNATLRMRIFQSHSTNAAELEELEGRQNQEIQMAGLSNATFRLRVLETDESGEVQVQKLKDKAAALNASIQDIDEKLQQSQASNGSLLLQLFQIHNRYQTKLEILEQERCSRATQEEMEP